jgi:hypothetical protein
MTAPTGNLKRSVSSVAKLFIMIDSHAVDELAVDSFA